MPKFLITLSGAMDDVPVALCKSWDEVESFIHANPPGPVDGADQVGIVHGYKVFKFVKGRPIKSGGYWWTSSYWPGPQERKQMPADTRQTFRLKLIDDNPLD